MKIVIFYEKPGCTTNAAQKKMLRSSGCLLIERNLLDHGMDKSSLREFFGNRPVEEWFNPNAPKIKKGEIDPTVLSENAAIELLMMEPILIRRPLMVIGNRRYCGFENEKIAKLLNLEVDPVDEGCQSIRKSCN